MTHAEHEHSLGNDELKHFYEQCGFAGRVGFGERPAVLIIDLAKAWTDPTSPIGSDLTSVIAETARILEVARRNDVPLYFTTTAFQPDLADCGAQVLRKKPLQRIMIQGTDWVALDPAMGFRDGDVLIVKQRASAFFGTTLLSQLVARSIDTLIITGCSTSGCVRASAQASHDNNLHTIVPREAVGDRSPIAHASNLFDIDARMADVVSVDDVLAYLEGVGQRQPVGAAGLVRS
ncbi:MAG: isochorismatase family protein [Thermomicrobiales bacterium]|nr:isochorismatase family protein [Thermomicrobiales bacterium]